IYSFVTNNKCINKPFLDTVYNLKRILNEDTPIFIDIYSKHPPLLILYQLTIIENLNTYPSIKYIVEKPAKTYNIETFLKETKYYDKVVLILKPQKKYDYLLKNYFIQEKVVIRGCFQIPLYEVIIVSK
ncbi:MAG: hypothetical protein DRO15_03625, partial [Thermoprotei archaeon]